MRIRFTKINIMTVELLGALLLHFGEIAVRFPCNHADVLMFEYRDCLFALLIFEIVYSIFKREVCIAFWLTLIFAISIPAIENKYNILITYENWINRGMPKWGCLVSCHNIKEGGGDTIKNSCQYPETDLHNDQHSGNNR